MSRRSSGLSKTRSDGFSLIELLVAVAILAIIMALLLPGVQKIRETMLRVRCANNMRQLSTGCQGYEQVFRSLPYARKYDIWDSYSWTTLVLPHVEYDNVFRGYSSLGMTPYSRDYNVNGTGTGPIGPIGNNPQTRESRHTPLPLFLCPTDRGATGNEMGTGPFGARRTNYRGCTSSGDMYGEPTPSGTPGPWGVGAFSVKPGQSFDNSTPRQLGVSYDEITDGTGQTMLLSEALVVGDTAGWGGPIGMSIYGNMGGALFTATLTPNSTLPDRPIGPCPANAGDPLYPAPCSSLGGNAWYTPSGAGAYTAARSRHRSGVNVAMVDGSVRYVTNSVDLGTWRAMGTRSGNDAAIVP